MTRQGADLTAHVTYFDPRTQASFVWDGRSDVIEVSLGGYGEPVHHTIPAPDWEFLWPPGSEEVDDTLPNVLRRIQSYCEDHAATLETY